MQSVNVCRFCGRTIHKEFLYCPWCGAVHDSAPDSSEVIDETCSRLEALQNRGRGRLLDRMEDSLQQLEEDLSLFISQKQDD